MSNVVDFGFDDGKVIKNQSIEQWKQSRPGERTRISIIAFKKFHDSILALKQKEKGSPLTDSEKADYISRVDKKISENLGKPVESLTEIDRVDIKQPRFSFAFTHFNESVGTIRCLSKYEGSTLQKAELCCDEFGDADQTIATVIMTYPCDEDMQVEVDILKARKMTNFFIWKMSAKKYKNLEGIYISARNDKRFTIDITCKLDGDPKFQKQLMESNLATWAKDGFDDPDCRAWILDQGIRNYKHVQNNLGFEMSKEKLIEKLGGKAQSAAALAGGEASAELPKTVTSYNDMI